MKKNFIFIFILFSIIPLALAGNNGQISSDGSAVMNLWYPNIPNINFEENIDGYDWGSTNEWSSAYFMENPTSGQVIKFISNNSEITFQPMALNWRNTYNQLEQISMVQNVIGFPNGETFLYPNIYGDGLSLRYKYSGIQLKEELIINSRNELLTPQQYIIDGGNPQLELNFIVSSDSKIIIDGLEWDEKTEKITSNKVEIKDDNDNLIYSLPIPKAVDSNGNEIIGYYRFKKSVQSLYISILIPYSWLNDINTIYPVYIDPTVIVINQDNITLFITPENKTCVDVYCDSSIIIKNEGIENITFNSNDLGVSIEGSLKHLIYFYDNITQEDININVSREITIEPNSEFIFNIKSTQIDYGIFKYNVTFDYNDETHLIDPYYYSTEDLTQSTTTSNTYQVKSTKTFTVTETTPYTIFARAEVTSGTTSSSVYTRLTINNVPYNEYVSEASSSSISSEYPNYMTAMQINLTPGTYTINLEWRSEINGVTSYIRNSYLDIIETPVFYKTESLTQQSVSNTAFGTNYATLTFTAPEPSAYLIVGTGLTSSLATNKNLFSRIVIDGVAGSQTNQEVKDVTDFRTFEYVRVQTLSASSHTITLQAYTDTGNTGAIKDLRIIAIPLTTGEYSYNSVDAETSATTSTWTTKLDLNFTPTDNSEYFLLSRLALKTSAGDVQNARMLVNGTPYCDHLKVAKDSIDYYNFVCQKKLNLLKGVSYNIQLQFRSPVADTVSVKEGRIFLWTINSLQCSPTLNENWIISDLQVCDNKNVTTGTGKIYITSTGSLQLLNNANVVSTGFPAIVRSSGAFDWRILIERGSMLEISR